MANDEQRRGRKLVASNRKARHDYIIEDTFEAGIVLTGTEVKALRTGRASLVDGYAASRGDELWLEGVHIPEYIPARGPTTPRAAAASCCCTATRSQDRRQSTESGHTSSRCSCTSRTAAPRSRSPSPRARRVRQAARPARAAGQPRGRARDRPRRRARQAEPGLGGCSPAGSRSACCAWLRRGAGARLRRSAGVGCLAAGGRPPSEWGRADEPPPTTASTVADFTRSTQDGAVTSPRPSVAVPAGERPATASSAPVTSVPSTRTARRHLPRYPLSDVDGRAARPERRPTSR